MEETESLSEIANLVSILLTDAEAEIQFRRDGVIPPVESTELPGPTPRLP